MNSFFEFAPGIFAKEKALRELKDKKEAKILVVSDSHGAIQELRSIIENYSANCDALVFCGDGNNEFFTILNEFKSNRKLRAILPPVISFVRGNNDPSFFTSVLNTTQKLYCEKRDFSAFTCIPKTLSFFAAGRKVFVAHGNGFGVYYSLETFAERVKSEDAQIGLFGHTHIAEEKLEPVYMMNPGSISLPRGLSKAGFAFLFITEDAVYSTFMGKETIAGKEYFPYNPIN